MEVMLQAVVVVFMLFLCSLCLFAVVVIVRDMIYENAKNRRARERDELNNNQEVQQVVQPQVQPIIVQVEAPSVKKEEVEAKEEVKVETPVEVKEVAPVEVAATEAPQEKVEDENAVAFSTNTLTMEEKYASLSREFKRYFDDIIRHALSKEGVKESKRTSSYDYKDGAYKVIKMMIKRGEIVCEFNFLARDLLDYVNASNTKMKHSATQIKIADSASVGVAKDGIDLVCKQIAEDKEHKKQLAREKRREKRKQANQNNGEE